MWRNVKDLAWTRVQNLGVFGTPALFSSKAVVGWKDNAAFDKDSQTCSIWFSNARLFGFRTCRQARNVPQEQTAAKASNLDEWNGKNHMQRHPWWPSIGDKDLRHYDGNIHFTSLCVGVDFGTGPCRTARHGVSRRFRACGMGLQLSPFKGGTFGQTLDEAFGGWLQGLMVLMISDIRYNVWHT